MIHNLGESNSIFNQYMAEIRDVNIQSDMLRFRRNLERIGALLAYEISKDLVYQSEEIQTPLGLATVPMLHSNLVLATILRAGLPMHQGMLGIFDKAESAFISAYRKHNKDGSFNIKLEYMAKPDLKDKILILSDPMLATGASMHLTYKALIADGKPKHTYLVAIIASSEGIEYVKKNFSKSEVSVWVGAIDDELTAQAYIVPGLGDAGDLAYGKKEDR
ncbi:MAG TPA: uracil phosphoribosyltransferase [Bacteroidales bacterium]|nr:uracil phosphoribosyltransferase [Bacteroidales bacterium]